jgi:hypothetical protein
MQAVFILPGTYFLPMARLSPGQHGTGDKNISKHCITEELLKFVLRCSVFLSQNIITINSGELSSQSA